MKNLYFLLMLLGWSAQAQITVRGQLIDKETNEPVISASIGLKGKASGTISNEEGIFQLSVGKDDQVMVSCLGYQLIGIPAGDFSDETKRILLEQSEEKLEEIFVTNTPLHELLRTAVTTSMARLNKPIHLQTYYREFVKTNNKYTNFADALVDYHVSGNTKKTKTDMVIGQIRTIDLKESDEEINLGLLTVENGLIAGYDFRALNQVAGDWEEYDFQIKSRKQNGVELNLIYFSPKPEVEKAHYEGYAAFDHKTKLIYEVKLIMAPSHQHYAKTIKLLIAKAKILDLKYEVAYKMVGNNYLLSYNNRFGKAQIWTKKRKYTMDSRSDLIVTNFGTEKGYDKKKVFKKKRLYDMPSDYTTKFWQQNNAIVLTAEEEKIVSHLEASAK